MQDAFRARVLFPIFSDNGEAVAVGGRVLPGSSDPAKYKNSPETPIYSKSRTLYGLNWAKADITNHDQVVVCEGYTDVIGFHRAGVPRAVATCGTAFTEEHVRLLKRYASRVVLAFDADAAGQGAAERFYEWEQKYQVEVAVARLPDGNDPGELAQRDPAALAAAVDRRRAVPRVPPAPGGRPPTGAHAGGARAPGRAGDGRRQRAPRRQRAQAVRRRGRRPDRSRRRRPRRRRQAPPDAAAGERAGRRSSSRLRENAEFAAITLLAQDWDSIAGWLIEELFHDDVHRRAFLALAAADGDLDAALDAADPDAREVLERAAVADLDVDPEAEARNLIAAAVRRELAVPVDGRCAGPDPRRRRGPLAGGRSGQPIDGAAAAGWLLGWLHRRMEQRAAGGN